MSIFGGRGQARPGDIVYGPGGAEGRVLRIVEEPTGLDPRSTPPTVPAHPPEAEVEWTDGRSEWLPLGEIELAAKKRH